METPPSQPPASPEAEETTESTALLGNTNRHNHGEVKRSQNLRTGLKMVLMLIGILLIFPVLLFLYLLYTYGFILIGWPLPPLSTKDFNSTFSVGFDLTPSYGTATVMYSNGTVVDIAKIDAPTEYVAMMQRLCLRSSTHLAAPYSGEIFEDYTDRPRKANRQRWKALGFAASKDVGIISNLVTALRKETERHLGTAMHSAVVVYPDLIALYREDIDDALEHSQLRTLSLEERFSLVSSMCQYNGTNLCYQPHHLAAAYAGNGLGLCRDFLNETACTAELRALPSRDTMELLFTRASFRGSLEAGMYSAYRPPHYAQDWPRSKFIDWDGGLDSLSDSSDPEKYWDLVRQHIIDLTWPFSWAPERPVSTVLLLGESAGDEEFIHVLNDTFLQQLGHLPTIYSSDPVYMAARGAAEFAMQLQGIITDRESQN